MISLDLAKYYKQVVLGNVWADVDLVIRCLGSQDDAAPAAKRARLAHTSQATGFLELARIPAHNIVLDTSNYFLSQQVRCLRPPNAPQGATLYAAVATALLGSVHGAACV
jgi:hypothetical protein